MRGPSSSLNYNDFNSNFYSNLQKDLFLAKLDPGSPKAGERKMSTSSSTSMKTKWLKAFRSLKPASGSGNDRYISNIFLDFTNLTIFLLNFYYHFYLTWHFFSRTNKFDLASYQFILNGFQIKFQKKKDFIFMLWLFY